jgi:hypothetical protein
MFTKTTPTTMMMKVQKKSEEAKENSPKNPSRLNNA